MLRRINSALDRISEYLANRKGLIPLLGLCLVILNAVLQFTPSAGWIADSNLFLHLGVILAIIGFLLAWAL
jgi:hypothetical protein